MTELKPFKTVIVGDYTATKHGNKIVVRRNDGAYKIMDMRGFFEFLKQNVPVVNKTPDKDCFVSKSV